MTGLSRLSLLRCRPRYVKIGRTGVFIVAGHSDGYSFPLDVCTNRRTVYLQSDSADPWLYHEQSSIFRILRWFVRG